MRWDDELEVPLSSPNILSRAAWYLASRSWMVSELEDVGGGVGELEFDGRLRMRIVGWNAPGGGDRTERDAVADGEIIRAGMGFGDFSFLERQCRQ